MRRSIANLMAIGATIALAGCVRIYTEPLFKLSGGAKAVTLTGAEGVPPVNTTGSGSGSLRVASDGAITGSITTKGVQGTMAHIHMAPKGQNGPMIIPLTKNGDIYTVPDGQKLTDPHMQAYKAGNLYVSVHSDRHKGGEVRGLDHLSVGNSVHRRGAGVDQHRYVHCSIRRGW